MDRFDPIWENHVAKIQAKWNQLVRPDDIVIIAGDTSWATNLKGAVKDFQFVENLPGKKIITIGNHDYWHQTSTKSMNWFFDNHLTMVPLIRNDYINIADRIAICSVKGYMDEHHPKFKEAYRQVYDRECLRLERTLRDIPQTLDRIILATHYPPVHACSTSKENKVMRIIKKYNVTDCIYGHLHGEEAKQALTGLHAGIKFHFVAADSNNFEPRIILNL